MIKNYLQIWIRTPAGIQLVYQIIFYETGIVTNLSKDFKIWFLYYHQGVTFVSFIYFYWTAFDECQLICNLEFLMRYFGACFSKTTIGIKRWDSFDYHSLLNKQGRRSTREMHTSFHQMYNSFYNFMIPITLINVCFASSTFLILLIYNIIMNNNLMLNMSRFAIENV